MTGLSEQAAQHWSAGEFSSVRSSDPRNAARVQKIAASLIRHPGASIPQACGQWSSTKGAYRLLAREVFDEKSLMDTHAQATLQRVREAGERGEAQVVLVAQDTTTLNFATRTQLEGMGPIGRETPATRGLWVHGSLCVGEAASEVYGLLEAKLWARDAQQLAQRAKGQRNRQRIEAKESYRWVEGWKCAQALSEQLGSAYQVVSISDREGDIYELFAERAQCHARTARAAEVLVRAQHNRQLKDDPGQRAWAELESRAAQGTMSVTVPRQGTRKERVASVEVRFAQVQLRCPEHKTKYLGMSDALQLSLVVIKEKNPPKGAQALCWRLWSSIAVSDLPQAARLARWYARRWCIEEFFRVLKTGCKVEQRQLHSLSALKQMIALDMIVAVTLLAISKKARADENLSAEGWLSPPQWKVLYCVMHKTRKPPKQAPPLRDCVIWIARLGGFLARKSDGFPGAQTLWRGWIKLQAHVEAAELFGTFG